MDDKTLLQRAARAAGIDLHWSVSGAPEVYNEDYTHRFPWNPFEDDGDAFRLMVTLGIDAGPESPDVIGKSLCRVSWLNRTYSLGEYGDGDSFVATRRAIVRAAAAMAGED